MRYNEREFVAWLGLRAHGVLEKREQASGFQSVLASVHALVDHLGRNGDRIDGVSLAAVQTFSFRAERNDDHNLRLLFTYLERDDLVAYTAQVSAEKYFQRKKLASVFAVVPDFKEPIALLKAAGISTAAQLLDAAAQRSGRKRLAAEAKIPLKTLQAMVHAVDLCRMTGMSGQTLRRALAMKFDTLEKFRASSPADIRGALHSHLKATGERTNTMVDWASFVHQANRLAHVVEG